MKNRHEEIMNILSSEGSATVGYLSQTLGVSEVTIRKDLNILEEKNKLYRSHGKAKLINTFTFTQNVNVKEKINVQEKNSIATAAAKIIDERDSIVIASGTTVTSFAKALINIKSKATVMSASTHVTAILSENKNFTIIQIGGTLRHSSGSVVGPTAERMTRKFSYNKLFIGVDGVDLDYGLTTTNDMEASLNVAMIEASQKIIVLTDSSKFGRRGFSKICNISDIDMIITDKGIPEKTLERLQEQGIEVIIAD